ncbi:MAG TPA: SHOCT domain-containing protein [Ktedonobacteraceae bacterium]|jgi:putative membrane protein
MMMGFGHGPGLLLPFLFLGRIFLLVLLGLLIWGLIRLFSTRGRHYHMPPRYNPVPPTFTPGTPPSQLSAMELLRQRYARGEIDTATFENMRERLENSGSPGPQ